jgi:hypothetical protein
MNPKDKVGASKPSLTLIPGTSLVHLSLAMKNGADKYGSYNWRENKVQLVTYLDAILRHTYAILDGEDIAEDSGVDHLAHIMANGAILLDCKETGNLIDNRPPKGNTAEVIKKNTKQAKVITGDEVNYVTHYDSWACSTQNCSGCYPKVQQ